MQNGQFILERKHINDEFKNIFLFPLTIAVAAMGYGKTTAARYFLDDAQADYVWLSVENDEISPQYIWDSFTRQIKRSKPELGEQLRALGFPADAAQREKIRQIIEDNTYRSNTVFVIDDYHFNHSPVLDRFVERMVKANIEGFHILILSRTLPEFGVEELMLKGYCYLIKNNYFELTIEEIREYFQLYGFKLSEEMTKLVFDISEGWVSAVYLMMKRYSETGRMEPGKSLVRLIDTAVMPRYTEKEIRLLKSLCIFDSFTPQQAVYVTGDPSTPEIIYDLSRENFFIRYDENNDLYKIHNIFNDYLKKMLESQPADMDLDTLFERFGTWCIEHGDILSGLRYLLKGNRFDLVLSEFENSRMTQIIDSNPGVILELFQKIPQEARYRHPIGLISYIGFYVTNVDGMKGEQLLTEAETFYKGDVTITPAMKKRISGEIELIRAYIAFNDVTLMHSRFKTAHGLLDGHSFIANKDKIVTFGSPHILYLYYRDPGKLLWTVERLEELYPYYGEMAGGCGVGFEYQIRAEYCLETGQLESAELFAYKAIYKARTLDQLSVIICSNLTLARILAARGQFDEALDIMDNLSSDAETDSKAILSSTLDLCSGYIGGVRGEESGFANWLRSGDINQSEVLYQGLGFNYIVYGKYLILKRNYIETEVLCEEMLRVFSTFHNLLGILHAHILDSIAKYHLYGMEKAAKALQAAADIGRADQIVLPFAEYGIFISDILKKITDDTRGDEYLESLTGWVNQYTENLKLSRKKNRAAGQLSAREKEILELLAAGRTNREIASALFIAEVTVRKTITSVYRKLDVSGRAAAVRKAIEQNLL